MTVLVAALRLGIVGPGADVDSPADLLPVLLATGLLCVVGLAWLTHRTTAWLATIGAAFVLTIDVATYARDMRPTVDDVTWQWLGITVSLAATLAVGSAAAYGFGRPAFRHERLGLEATLVIVGLVSLIASWAVSNPAELTFVGTTATGLGSLGLVTRTFLILTPVFTALGIVGDLLPSAQRAWRRVGVTHNAATPLPERIRAWTLAFADDLSPGRRRARWAVLSERSRFARDVHSDVVPGLRQALADAENGVDPDRLAASLRGVLADLENVGQAQHPIQLEIGGLVPAIEWLAERVEQQSGTAITIDVAEPPTGGEGEPPSDVAASAFRVAALALANVSWHAPGSPALVTVCVGASLIDLSIADEGPGISDEALIAARANSRRGLADMAAEAADVNAKVDVGRGPGGVGTVVTFTWRSATDEH